MLKSTTLALTIAAALAAGALPAVAFAEGGNNGNNSGFNGGDGNKGGDGGDHGHRHHGPTNNGSNGAVPGPLEGVGLPFLVAGGALAAVMVMRKRSGSNPAA